MWLMASLITSLSASSCQLKGLSWAPLSCLSIYSFSNSLGLAPLELMTQPVSSTLLIVTLIWWIASLGCLIGAQINVPSLINSVLCLLVMFSFILCHSFWFYISFESCLIPMLFLLLGYGPQPERVQAAMNMILYTVISSLPFLVLLLSSGSFFFSASITKSVESLWVMGLLFLPFYIKLPGYFVHLWLPKAHVEAPVTGSMLLASLLLKLGLIGFYRVSCLGSQVLFSLGVAVILGGLISLVVMLSVVDLKAVVAYCSIAHMAPAGAIIVMWGLCGEMGWVYILVAHGLVSPMMFYLATIMYSSSSSRSLLLNQGMLSSHPVLCGLWGASCVMNISVPPLLGFVGELWVLISLLSMSLLSYMVVLLSVFLGIVVFTYLFSSLCHGSSLESSPVKQDLMLIMVYFMSCSLVLGLMLLVLQGF